MRYTDGLVTFSLFESLKGSGAPAKPDEAADVVQVAGIALQQSRRNQTHILRWSVSGVDFALIGELNSAELVKVAESVIRAAGER